MQFMLYQKSATSSPSNLSSKPLLLNLKADIFSKHEFFFFAIINRNVVSLNNFQFKIRDQLIIYKTINEDKMAEINKSTEQNSIE